MSSVPQAGDTAVDPSLKEIRVTFSKDMLNERSWSVCQISDETYPKIGEVHWDPKDKRTIVVPVELQPGKTYVLWFNSSKFHNFLDADKNSAVPYLLVFQTAAAGRPDFLSSSFRTKTHVRRQRLPVWVRRFEPQSTQRVAEERNPPHDLIHSSSRLAGAKAGPSVDPGVYE